MKIVIINGTYRPKGTTTELSRSFMEGARSEGAETEMIMLRDCSISPCTNCLQCYLHKGDGIAPCSIQDDMDMILKKIAGADGVLFASPVHCGFVTGLMTIFHERLAWRVMRPSSSIIKCAGMKSRLSGKVRAVGSLVSSGGMPGPLSRFCDDGTRWLKDNLPLELHGRWIGAMYACADLERLPQSEQDWEELYMLRRVSTRQRAEAHQLGVLMARAIRSGKLTPVTMDKMFPPVLVWLIRVFLPRTIYRVAE